MLTYLLQLLLVVQLTAVSWSRWRPWRGKKVSEPSAQIARQPTRTIPVMPDGQSVPAPSRNVLFHTWPQCPISYRSIRDICVVWSLHTIQMKKSIRVSCDEVSKPSWCSFLLNLIGFFLMVKAQITTHNPHRRTQGLATDADPIID